jgi:hypothetical protein
MKRIFQYLMIIILFSFWGVLLTNKNQVREVIQDKVKAPVREYIDREKPCSKSLEYSIGRIDSKFNISPDEFSGLAREAEKLWNDAAGKPLLHYNPNSPFKINLLYDERQAQTDAAEDMESKLQDLEATHNELENQANSLNKTYKKKLSVYESAISDYKKRIKKYNDDVKYWNEKGGAPKETYDVLQKEKKGIDDEYKDLEKMRNEVNNLAGKNNEIASKDAGIVNNYNASIMTYKKRYGGTREFEKGIYDGQEINIYQFKEKADLRLTLVHEMGHALGLDHVENTESIMYYMIGDQDMDNPKFSGEDIAELNKACQF